MTRTVAIKEALQIHPLAMQLGLSAIKSGLEDMQRGRTLQGFCLIGHGLDYLRSISEQHDGGAT